MTQDSNWWERILAKDSRYRPEAYELLFESLEFTRKQLAQRRGTKIRHVSGRELLEGLRDLALEHYGRMAKTVLNQFGIHATGDVGEMVFNLIEIGDMEKTDQDSRSDFENVYDFDEVFCKNYRIAVVDESS